MNLLKTIRKARLGQLLNLFRLCMAHVDFIRPTFNATKRCMQLSTEHFGRKHYLNGQANAFRHALWNVLIGKTCWKGRKGIDRVVQWTKKITDWHEEAFFSQELPMKMDFHNNAVGRILFETKKEWTEDQFIQHLLHLTAAAVKIDRRTDLGMLTGQLVYISNDD